ncbi:MAG: hypothetical protein LBU29_00020, partial [Endomicrobium sp.]|nr:hypothetical protein [Endomicrobium sp.]
ENSFLDLAIKNNLTISDAYIGRKNDVAISKFRDEEMNRVVANNADKEYIYVFSRPESARVYQDYLQITTLDGVIIGVKK